jgi:hypothetical protein
VLQENNYRLTPWVSPEDVRRYGALFVCDSRIASCMQQVRQLKPAPRLVKSVSIRHAGASADGERFPISIFMIPPGRAA